MNKTLVNVLQSQASLKESDSSKEYLNIRNAKKTLGLENRSAALAYDSPKDSGIIRLKLPKFSNKEIKIYEKPVYKSSLSKAQDETLPKMIKGRDTILSLNTNCKRGETQATSNFDRETKRGQDAIIHSKTVNTNHQLNVSKRSKWDKFHTLFSCVKKMSTIKVKRIKTMKDLDSHIDGWRNSIYSKNPSRIMNTDRRQSDSNLIESETRQHFDKSLIIKKTIDIIEK